MDFEIIGELTEVVTIASGTGVRDRARLKRVYGPGRGASARGSRVFVSQIAESAWRRFIGMKLMESERKNSN
jgi:hypothetical protein